MHIRGLLQRTAERMLLLPAELDRICTADEVADRLCAQPTVTLLGNLRLFLFLLLQIKLDDISTADAVAIGLCVMPALTHLTLESNASAIGVTGAAGLVPLTSLKELVLPSQALGDQGLQVGCILLVCPRQRGVERRGYTCMK
jgi:hypothetical protein